MVNKQAWHLITGCYLCVGLTPKGTVLRSGPNMTLTVEQGDIIIMIIIIIIQVFM